MDKMLSDNLHMMLCRELGRFSQEGINNHNDLDMVKDLLESIKNIDKIRKYEMGGEMQMQPQMQGMSNTGNMPYLNGPMMDNSYARNNSYGYDPNYDPMYSQRNMGNYGNMRGYSGASKETMIHDLKSMLDETKAADVKQAISNCISLMEK